jgi:hypothetical protein
MAQQAPVEANAEPNAPEPASIAPLSIRVVTTGEAPRRALRWKFEKGSKETLEIRDETTIYTVTIEAQEARANGTIRIAFEVVGVEFPEAPSDPKNWKKYQARFEAMQAWRATFEGKRGTYLVDLRGIVSAVHLDAGSEDAYVEHVLRQFLRRTTVPVPEEELGVGSQWAVQRVAEQEGVLNEEVSTVELTGIEGSRVKLLLKIDTTAGHTSPDAAPSQPLTLSRYKSEETGAGTWDLERLVPLSLKIESATESSIRVPEAAHLHEGDEAPFRKTRIDRATVMTRK